MTIHGELLIGLGGVGGRVLQEFRRMMVTRQDDADLLTGCGVSFEYLYLDSNDDIRRSSGWQTAGKSFDLLPRDFVHLKTPDSIEEFIRLPHLSPWISDLCEHDSARFGCSMDEAQSRLRGMAGSGQLRRFGRFLFACHVSLIRSALQEKLERWTHDEMTCVNVRIFCSLGGGTGSGSLIDMIGLLHNTAREMSVNIAVHVYPFIAGPAAECANAGTFYENEYATLRDLNALMVERYHPQVAGRGEESKPFAELCPVKQVYLSTEMVSGSPDLKHQIKNAAGVCFESILLRNFGTEPSILKALETEDLHVCAPGEPSYDNLLRSYRFAAPVVCRWCVPLPQMKQLLKADCEKHVLKTWLKGSPVSAGRERSDDISIGTLLEAVRPEKVLTLLERKTVELTAPVTELVQASLQNRKQEADILPRIRAAAEKTAALNPAVMQDAEWRSQLEIGCEQDAEALVAYVQTELEQRFLWKDGSSEHWGLSDVCYALHRCMAVAHHKVAVALALNEGRAEENETVLQKMKIREQEWTKIGFFTLWGNKKKARMIQAHAEDAASCIASELGGLRREATLMLFECISKKLGNLCKNIELIMRCIQERMLIAEHEIRAGEGDLSRSFPDMCEFDEANLNKLRETMTKMVQPWEKEMVSTYNPLWCQYLGDFSSMTREKFDNLCGEMERSTLERTSKYLHDEACCSAGIKAIWETGILDSLYEMAGPEPTRWEERLVQKVRRFIEQTLRTGMLDADARGLIVPHVSPQSVVSISLPYKGMHEFQDWLVNQLKQDLGEALLLPSCHMETCRHKASHEINVLVMQCWFPARFAHVVQYVHDRYEATASKLGGEHILYFANIDDAGIPLESSERPSLLQ